MKKRIAVVTAIVAAGVVALGGTSIAVASSLPEGTGFSLAPAALSESTATDDLINAQRDDNDHDDDVVDSHDDDADDTDGNSDDDSNDNDADDHGDDVVSEADFAAASAAALAAAGGGTVTDVESSDDGDHAWEVDVTLDSGEEIDVELDASFTLVRVDND